MSQRLGERRPGRHRDLSIGVSQSLWLAGQGGLAADAARSERNAVTQQLESVETRIAAQTRRAFLEVLVAREELITADQLVDSLLFARRVRPTSPRGWCGDGHRREHR
ncbi:MAG: TolC family protein [Gammaproteobacteria bacterium]|nr:TolC family protein [Gammaproteobacteria bacterium]